MSRRRSGLDLVIHAIIQQFCIAGQLCAGPALSAATHRGRDGDYPCLQRLRVLEPCPPAEGSCEFLHDLSFLMATFLKGAINFPDTFYLA